MSKKPKSVMRRIHGMMFKLPFMITCEAFEDFILAYLEDGLPRRQKTVFELHLKMCRECREYLDAYRASMELAKDALRDGDDLRAKEVPDDLIKAVLAARDS